MKRYLVVGDVHISSYSSILRKRGDKYSVRLEKLIEALNWVESLAIEKGCTGEIFLGDTLDRPDMSCEEITAIQDVKWNNLPKTFLVGNHESNVMSLDFSSTKVFENDRSRIVDKPLIEDINDKVSFTYIPYLTNDQVKPLSTYIKPGKKSVVFAHEDLAGLQYGKYTSKSGFDIKDVENSCNLFIDGHLHNGGTVGKNIILMGNLSGQNFTEDAFTHEHVVGILTVEDDGTIGLETVEVKPAMNFYKVRIDKMADLGIFDKLKDNAVVSATCSYNLVEQVNNILRNNQKIIESKVTVFFENGIHTSEETVNFVVEDHLKQFIDFIQSKMEPSSILSDELSKLGGN